MQGAILNELLSTMDAKMFNLAVQLLLFGAIGFWLKDMNSRIVNYYKLKMSDFGRGTKVLILGHEGFISRIGFNEVEITIDVDKTLFIPVNKFISTDKIIVAKQVHQKIRDEK